MRTIAGAGDGIKAAYDRIGRSGNATDAASNRAKRMSFFHYFLPEHSHISSALLRPNARDVQTNAIQGGTCAEIKGLSVGIAPVKVMRVTRRDDCAEMFAFRRDHPQPARTGHVQIAF